MKFNKPYAGQNWGHPVVALILVAVALFLTTGLTFATENQALRKLEIWRPRLEDLQSALKQPDINKDALAGIKNELEDIRKQYLQVKSLLGPDLKKLEEQTRKLGPKPKSGDEAEEITLEREVLEKKLLSLRSLIKQLDVVDVRAAQITNTTAELQRTQFTTRVLTVSRSILNPVLWLDGAGQFNTFLVRAGRNFTVWLVFAKQKLNWKSALILAACLGFCWFFPVFLRAKLSRLLGPNPANPHPSQLEQLWRASRTPLVNCLLVMLMFIFIGFGLDFADFLSLRVERLYTEVVKAILLYVLMISLTQGILAPDNAVWRLPRLSDDSAKTLKRYLDMLGLFLALNLIFVHISSALFLPVQFTQALSAVSSIAILVVAALGLLAVSHFNHEDPLTQAEHETGRFMWARKSKNLLWIVVILATLALLAGYLALSLLLSQQLIATSLLVTIIYLLHCLVDEILTTGLARGWVLGDFLRKTFNLSDTGISRIALLCGTTFDFILVFVGLPMIISLWAITWVDLNSWVSKLFFGVQIGGVSISLSVVFIAVAAFLGIIVLTRLMIRWLDSRVLSRTHMDRGVKDSIKTALGYAGFIFAALFAFSYTGFDFSKIAIVAGALSVGIGFGLQSVVNNFVSGLILLVERPIKVGDWIVVSSGEGYVKNIKVRSTEIETFDRATIIVPNSSLISESVQNWTHSNSIGRVKILVGVSYNAEPREVEKILLECAFENENILHTPKPWVLFKDFGSSSLDFELRAYLSDVDKVYRVASNLRFAIFDALKAANIEIPFPQRDIHIRSIGELENIIKSKK